MLYKFDGKTPRVSKTAYISETATVIGDVTIGDNCYIGHGAILRGDYGRIVIEYGTAVEEGAIVHAPPNEENRIKDQVTIGHNAVIHGAVIEKMAVVGMGAITSLWSEIGEGAIIAEGGVVKARQIVPPMVVAAGNPVKIVREVSEKDTEFWRWGKKLYIELAERYIQHPMEPVTAVYPPSD
ncbi:MULTISPECIES: gamma carbonic anhydrase family protein [Desulfococcus]|jgi:carbonic anhydrase/acetyltransferase-like protein (isoleucine patch superfamily)|uniref:Transferase hexapeptide repeat containing protein n=1 Tax=Desulfococcus multivorans DSM 2059 TaxID=1121405 RepID=S7UXB2_DESML|nr:gamma carbonic anhydrase family protein [Desulfococcus multivorans]AOY57750.1 putative transferase [Desulfococcus multivorans]AQV00140.1 gamma carbonic anhydrase family protein [Desulfococcus multivorans]EPR38834.1 transferase hexapeptide repeat containing protein [Desulfococcus multivorans DSM 2059]MDX9817504.1 gamma carbonic anhydrase family protein [Desulfococcus multivorans]SJZ80623.1 Carbonic anhydrase or acetyltransferase, isoleucine patch superfamily [Desulfococcus multivorans DSM 20